VDPLQVGFCCKDNVRKFTPLNSNFNVGDLISAEAKLDMTYSDKRKVTVGSNQLNVLNGAFLYNKSGTVEFTIWEEIPFFEKEAKEGHLYFKLENLLLNEFRGEISLTACSETDVVLILQILSSSSPKKSL